VRRTSVAFFVLAAAIAWPNRPVVLAHAALRLAYPLEGATLGDTPTAVQLSFREKPEPSLSAIRVLDPGGASYHVGRPLPVVGDPLSLTVPVRHLDRGIYLVSWRILSAVDGHATAGVYAFGVLMSPSGTAASSVTYPAASWLEILARWLFIVGLVGLLGASSAGVAQFGETRDLLVSGAAWLLAATGVLLLADAQRRNAAASFADLLSTSIGRALVWRTLSLGAAGIALILTHWSGPRMRRVALAGVALATLAAMAVHVEAGHAAAGRWPKTATVGAQLAHFAFVGIWLGGLAALLVGVRGTPSAAKTAAVRRFSTIAAAGLFVVAGTGIVRAVSELSSWADLSSTAYGRLLSAKIALLLVIASLGAVNRWTSVPAAAISLRALRRTAGCELAVAALVLAATAILVTLPPPASSPLAAPLGISTSGTDFAQSVRVELTAASDQPGANRFVVRAVDYDSKTPVRAKRVSLRFTPLDDPGDESTSLALAPGPDDSYVGSGANMAFDGRWRVTVLIERAADSTEVPLELETRIAPRFVTVERMPDQTTRYTVELLGAGVVQFSADPERAGPGKLFVSCFDFIGDPLRIESMIVTSRTAGPAHPLLVRRLAGGRFVADIDLQAGRNTIGAVARTSEGARLRAVITIDVTAR
jgi:copper transport protein